VLFSIAATNANLMAAVAEVLETMVRSGSRDRDEARSWSCHVGCAPSRKALMGVPRMAAGKVLAPSRAFRTKPNSAYVITALAVAVVAARDVSCRFQ
jgi:hypothetical protein